MKTIDFRQRRLVAALACVAIALAAACTAWTLTRREAAPRVGYVLLNGANGDSDHWRGKVVLVNFWATDCASCVDEMPQLAATFRQYQARGFETLAVSMSYDAPARVRRFAQRQSLPFDVTIDTSGEIAQRFGKVELTPTSLLINKQGEIVKRYLGPLDFRDIQQSVERLLAES